MVGRQCLDASTRRNDLVFFAPYVICRATAETTLRSGSRMLPWPEGATRIDGSRSVIRIVSGQFASRMRYSLPIPSMVSGA